MLSSVLTSSKNLLHQRHACFNGIRCGPYITISSYICDTGHRGVHIDITPRPAGACTSYKTAYTTYGILLFFSQSTYIVVSNNQVHNTTPDSGHGPNSSGGARDIVCSLRHGITLHGYIIRCAPGQDICAGGTHQDTYVSSAILPGKLHKILRDTANTLFGKYCKRAPPGEESLFSGREMFP